VGVMLCLPVLAAAHVSVRPRESKPAVEERYTVRVPTEGAVATTCTPQVFHPDRDFRPGRRTAGCPYQVIGRLGMMLSPSMPTLPNDRMRSVLVAFWWRS
jgi:hypothetical protein